MRQLFCFIAAVIFCISFNQFNVNAKKPKVKTPIVAYKLDSLWHFINSEGKEFIKPLPLVDVLGYCDGLIRAKINIGGKVNWAFINLKGEIVLALQCNYILDFKSGLAMVTIARSKKEGDYEGENSVSKSQDDESSTDLLYGFIDRRGNQVVPITNLDATSFSEGLAYLMNPKERGYIDSTGKFVLKMEDIVGYEFSEGLAAVSNAQFKVGFIDKQGKLVINYLYDEPANFSEGKVKINIEGKFGFINRQGDIVIPLQFDDARDFRENRSFAGKINKSYAMDWALIDTTGKLLTGYIYKYASEFSEGKAAVLVDSLWDFIDYEGNQVYSLRFNYADSYVNGLAWASRWSYGKYGFINHKGDYVITIPKPDKAVDLRLNREVR